MKQSSLDLNLSTRKTRKQVFLQQMETMLRVHFIQQWFSLSDSAMEEAFFDTPLYREFAQLSAFAPPA